jgi:DNA-binding NarL/FixJ family response regulator
MTSVLIVDDHSLFADMLREFILIDDPTIEISTADSLTQAEAILDKKPDFDLILLDLNMPGTSGLAGFERLRHRVKNQRIAVVSGQARQSDMKAAFKTGAVGFVPKSEKSDIFVHALKLMLAGGRYVPNSLLDGDQDDLAPSSEQALSPREAEVFDALLGGRSNGEIAEMLMLKEPTVKMHLQRIFQKIGAKNRGDAIRIGLQRTAR